MGALTELELVIFFTQHLGSLLVYNFRAAKTKNEEEIDNRLGRVSIATSNMTQVERAGEI